LLQGKIVIAEVAINRAEGHPRGERYRLLFDVEDELLARPARSVPAPVVGPSETDLTPVAGVTLREPAPRR